MKKLIFLILFLGFVSVGFAQKPNPLLRSLVENEQAFSRLSEVKGTRESFMTFIADDGILFRPWAVRGKQWMIDHPLPPSDKRSLLVWQPTFADVARAGDMGYTTGPWQFKADIHDAKPVAFGNFITVWKKQADGSWKFAVDLGISNPDPTHVPETSIFGSGLPKWTGHASRIESRRNAVLALEHAMSQVSKGDPVKSFEQYAADYVRLYREGKFPFVGRPAASAQLSTASSWTWQPLFADVSLSNDLGYTYGNYHLETKGSSAPAETGNYLRIWKMVNGHWRVVVDVANPVPPENKKRVHSHIVIFSSDWLTGIP